MDLGYIRAQGVVDERIPQYIDFYESLFTQVNAPAALRAKVNAGNIRALFALE